MMKSPWASKTLWVNVLLAVAAIAELAARSQGLGISPIGIEWLLFGAAAINIVLRFATTQPIRPTRPPDG